MTLQNLAKIGQLKPHAPAAAEIQRLLIAVKRNLADAAKRGNRRMPLGPRFREDDGNARNQTIDLRRLVSERVEANEPYAEKGIL